MRDDISWHALLLSEYADAEVKWKLLSFDQFLLLFFNFPWHYDEELNLMSTTSVDETEFNL